ncbi:membrane-associated protein, putative [Bodo saltans]|uniref:Membrane-associated protein, putative n=1 Tax=Bodo saltans TaxID=75058 RepID=A0A0S4IPX2_BODSA|nr:membrane-associated protein, putative [Bodo saltans]|eukprot:CUE70305.1 membrane-associated protein, putative [Bodo saltans]
MRRGAAAAAAAAVAGGSSREEMQPDSPLKDDLEIEQHYSMPRWVRVVVPLGYWAPEDDTKRWGAGFSKMGEFHRDDKWCETILPMLSGIFSGAASGLYDRPACQPIMGVLGSMFLLAAVVIVWVQPYRMAPLVMQKYGQSKHNERQ